MNSPLTPSRKPRANFEDIATVAGVSVSTVNRVLNEIGSVSEKARRDVLDAARNLGINRILPDERTPILHFDVLLPKHHSPLLRGMEQTFKLLTHSLGRNIHIHQKRFAWDDEKAFADAVGSPAYPRSGLMVFAPDVPQVRDALHAVINRGEPVATLICDFDGLPPHHYCGIDHFNAGQTSGYWMGRLAQKSGKVLIALGMPHNACHEQRAAGFESALQQFGPYLTSERLPQPTRDDAELARRMVERALDQGPVVGIYDTGYATTGIGAALARYHAKDRMIWVTHEMLDEHRLLLDSGTIDFLIDQDPPAQILSGLRYLLKCNGRGKQLMTNPVTDFRLYSAPNAPRTSYLQRYQEFPAAVLASS